MGKARAYDVKEAMVTTRGVRNNETNFYSARYIY